MKLDRYAFKVRGHPGLYWTRWSDGLNIFFDFGYIVFKVTI